MTAKILIAAAFLSAISLLIPLPFPIQVICGFVQAFILPGFVLLSFLSSRQSRSWHDDIYFSVLLSPIVLSLLVLGAHRITGGYPLALKTAGYVLYAGLAAALAVGRLRGPCGKKVLPDWILLVSLLYAGSIAILYASNHLLLTRSDAWYHASLVTEISTRGIPPFEPWLPDFPVRYMWIYHLFLASWKALSGMALFPSMGIFNISAAFALPYLAGRLAGHFTHNRKYLLSVPLLAIAGLESASWILWPVGLGRSLFGEVRGIEEISRQLGVAMGQLNSCEVIRFLRPYGTWMVNLTDKYLTVTAFGYSLDLVLLALLFFISFRAGHSSRIRTALLMTVICLGAFLFHVITGTALICTVLGASTLLLISDRFLRHEKSAGRLWYLLPLSALAAGALGFPYFLSLGADHGASPAARTGMFHIGLKNILTIALPLLILFHPSRLLLRKIFSRRERMYDVFSAWILCLLVLNIFVDLPTRNESKLIYPLMLIIGIPLYIEIVHWIQLSRGAKKRLVSAFILVLFLFPPVLTMRGFAMEKGAAETDRRRSSLDRPEREAFDWIMKSTSARAVVAERGLDHLAAVYSGRRLLFSDRGVMNVLGYGGKKYESYRAIRDSLYSAEPFSPADLSAISAKGLDLYVILRKNDFAELPALRAKYHGIPDRMKRVFDNSEISIYHFVPDLTTERK